MHLAPLIVDLAIILAVAGLMSFLFQKIRQPVVLGYILAGFIVGPYTPPFQLVTDIPSIQTLAELGVIFLMFTLGLEFSFRKLLSVGGVAFVTAGLEVIFFLIVGYWVGIAIGWSKIESIFLGAMLSISSTTIIIKALEELKLKTHRFASLIFAVLVVEDLFAILLLVGLTTIASTQTFSPIALGLTTVNLVLFTGTWFVIGHFLIPRLMSYIARKGSNEMLTLVSIGLCLSLVVVATHFGYSPALGAFIMGSILAETKVIHQIEVQMAPLKDLFGAIFFVSIGMLIDPKSFWEFKGIILILSLVTILGKVFITSIGPLLSGQSLKNSVQVGLGLAQIGEFSFIIAGLGIGLKAIGDHIYPIAVAVSLITTFTTPYLIKSSSKIAKKLDDSLPDLIKDNLLQYSIWLEHQRTDKKDLASIVKLFIRWIINAIIVIVIFNNCFKFLATKNYPNEIILIFAFLISLPFIWGMLFFSKKMILEISKGKKIVNIAFLFVSPFLTSILLAIISSKYFSMIYILPAAFLFLTCVYYLMFKKLEEYSGWFNNQFKGAKNTKSLNKLGPWDKHLFNFEVHPNSTLVKKTLVEAKIRSLYGINIVAIKRGNLTISAPAGDESILPHDQLIVLGTDEQLEIFREKIEAAIDTTGSDITQEQFFIKFITLNQDSVLIKKSIEDLQLRELHKILIVGIERGSFKIMNPKKDFVFQPQDTVWLVGEKASLDSFINLQVN